MPYTETHEISIGPITLPDGVSVDVVTAVGTGGLQQVTVRATTPSSKADTVNLLRTAFAMLITAASSEGVGQPVFGRDIDPPSVPQNVIASAISSSEVDVAWSPSTDNVAVAAYDVVRDGVSIATLPATTTSYHDVSVVSGASYSYTVLAVDTTKNVSSPSKATLVTVP